MLYDVKCIHIATMVEISPSCINDHILVGLKFVNNYIFAINWFHCAAGKKGRVLTYITITMSNISEDLLV